MIQEQPALSSNPREHVNDDGDSLIRGDDYELVISRHLITLLHRFKSKSLCGLNIGVDIGVEPRRGYRLYPPENMAPLEHFIGIFDFPVYRNLREIRFTASWRSAPACLHLRGFASMVVDRLPAAAARAAVLVYAPDPEI